MSNVFVYAFFTTLSLILPIGAQNAFVLKQGIRGQFILPIVLFCVVSDALLIAAGVSGFDRVIARWPILEAVSRYGGAAFLLIYGARSFHSAWVGQKTLVQSELAAPSLSRCLMLCAAFTWLNPHVYLDTVVLLGAISAQFPNQKWEFILSASAASTVFFFSLGYGARVLRPLFARAKAWQVLDGLIGLVMWTIALQLLIL